MDYLHDTGLDRILDDIAEMERLSDRYLQFVCRAFCIPQRFLTGQEGSRGIQAAPEPQTAQERALAGQETPLDGLDGERWDGLS
jgi:hypothetical protein